jgi:hypothetical protein
VKRVIVTSAVLASLALAAPANAFHHGATSSAACAAAEGANNNPTARAALNDRNPVFDASRPGAANFPPFGTPGAGRGQGGEHCAGS